MDSRHRRRITIVQELYSKIFNSSITLSGKAKRVIKNLSIIDEQIKDAAPKYSIDKVSKVDLSILRLAVYELVIEQTVPPKVIINEAVELAKEMAGEKSPAFVNAVLGKIYEAKKSRES